jgi:hypothetical protein
MAIPNLKTKITQNLAKDIAAENSKGGDRRKLNYFDLKEGQKMKILFIPDTNGQFWTKYGIHGPKLKVKNREGKDQMIRGAGVVNCSYRSSSEDCPACQKGFDLFAEAKETNSKELKEEGKKWMPKDITLTTCVVLDSPFEIQKDDKNNEIKLFELPYAIENIIKNQISEGQISEDEICEIPFVIKKTSNGGGFASYENSYFERSKVTDEELEYLEDAVADQYDFSTLDSIPNNTTTEEVVAWLEKAEDLYAEALKKVGISSPSRSSGNAEEDDKPLRGGNSSSKLDEVREKAKQEAASDKQEVEADEPAWDTQEDQQASSEESSGSEEEQPKMSARERLLAMKNNRK